MTVGWTWLIKLLGKENIATKAIDVIENLTDKIPEGNEKLKIQLAFQELLTGVGGKMLEMQEKILELQAKIMTVEMQGNWLQRSWRPILMLVFGGLLVCRWLGVTDTIDKDVEIKLMDILELGIGGYIIGRTGEKIVKELNLAQILKKK